MPRISNLFLAGLLIFRSIRLLLLTAPAGAVAINLPVSETVCHIYSLLLGLRSDSLTLDAPATGNPAMAIQTFRRPVVPVAFSPEPACPAVDTTGAHT